MLPLRSCRFTLLFGVVGGLLLLSGCDNTIEPFSGGSTFSIYGYLNLSEPRQFVRVKDMNQPLVGDSTRTIDATVRLENLDTGASYPMQDSAVAFDGVYTHNFWVNLDVVPNTAYRVTVTRSDGTTTRSTTRTPRAIAPVPTPASGNCLTSFRVPLPDIRDTQRIRQVAVGFLPEQESSGPGGAPGPGGDRNPGDTTPQVRIWVAAEDSESIQVVGFGGGEDVQLRFTPEPVLGTEIASQNTPPFSVYTPRCLKLGDDRIRVAYLLLGPDWFYRVPQGDVSFDPSTSNFVENGIGFLGALRRDTVSITVDTSNVIILDPSVSHTQRRAVVGLEDVIQHSSKSGSRDVFSTLPASARSSGAPSMPLRR